MYKPEPTDPGLNFKGLNRSGCRYLNADLYLCYALNRGILNGKVVMGRARKCQELNKRLLE